MKKLYTKVITVYKCEFCNRRYQMQKRCLEHEFHCYKNPERHCNTCDDGGIENVSYVGEERSCSSCRIAEQAGGKSYVSLALSPERKQTEVGK